MQNGPEGQNKEGTEKNPPVVEEVVTKASCFISVGVGVGGATAQREILRRPLQATGLTEMREGMRRPAGRSVIPPKWSTQACAIQTSELLRPPRQREAQDTVTTNQRAQGLIS